MVEISLLTGRALVAIGLLSSVALAGTADHRYKSGEHVELWVNKVSFRIGSWWWMMKIPNA